MAQKWNISSFCFFSLSPLLLTFPPFTTHRLRVDGQVYRRAAVLCCAVVFTAQKKLIFGWKTKKRTNWTTVGMTMMGTLSTVIVRQCRLECLHISVHKSNKCITHKDIGKKRKQWEISANKRSVMSVMATIIQSTTLVKFFSSCCSFYFIFDLTFLVSPADQLIVEMCLLYFQSANRFGCFDWKFCDLFIACLLSSHLHLLFLLSKWQEKANHEFEVELQN